MSPTDNLQQAITTSTDAEIERWRQLWLNSILRSIFILGWPVTLAGAVHAMQGGIWTVVWTNMIGMVLATCLMFAKQLSLRTRATSLAILLVGTGCGLMTVFVHTGLLVLCTVPLLCALLLGQRQGYTFLVLVSICIPSIGLSLGLSLPRAETQTALTIAWLFTGLDYFLVNAVLTMSPLVLVNHIRQAVDKATDAHTAMEKLALYDSLTNLPNRRLLLQRLERAIRGVQKNHSFAALLFVDLDHFKNINDSYGHLEGDKLLQTLGQRFTQVMRHTDTLARTGGDEFVVLLEDLGSRQDEAMRTAMNVAEKLLKSLEEPVMLAKESCVFTASIGVTLLNRFTQSSEDLMCEADTAMYHAKGKGRNRAVFFHIEMQQELQYQLALERDLGAALDRQEMTAFVQAQVDRNGQIVGLEMLMRWHPLHRNSTSPAEFIPVAEQTGIILPLGAWMLEEACKTACAAHRLGQQLTVSVNISPKQFHQADMVQRTVEVLARYGVEPCWLILEVTEGLLIDETDDTISRMHELAKMGFKFSIDDFGTGYSSLSYLKRLPLYELKIDKSFVMDTPGDTNDAAIVQLVLSMAHALKLKVVAEGVETREQVDFLVANGCQVMQGYYWYRPMACAQWLTEYEASLQLPLPH